LKTHSISIVGIGYVGLCTAIAFASRGFKVLASDIDKNKVALINKGKAPIHEPNINEQLQKVVKNKRLKCILNRQEAVLNTDITFITVGTPSKPDGSINIQYIKKAAEEIGEALSKKDTYHLVVVKSTVVPGTSEKIVKPTLEKHSRKHCGKDFGLCVNPEFLREGSALQDTLHPDRVIIGEYDKKSGVTLQALYRDFYGEKTPPIIRTNPPTAELTKYSSNAFLATKISFMNTIANVCEKIPSVDVTTIAKGMGLDRRIGQLFLNAGLGYGGSCFPKDVKALIAYSKNLGCNPELLQAVENVNETQPYKAIQLCKSFLGNLEGKKIAILGLAFKPDTDDMREAKSIPIINQLLKEGAKITAYDPAAIPNAKSIFKNKIRYVSSSVECLREADCCILITEWEEFKRLKPENFISRMRNPIVIDGRRIYDPREFSRKLKYVAIGLGSKQIQIEPDEGVWINPALAVNVIVEDKGMLLLVKRRFEPFKGLWSLPGGYVEYGETVENAAKREIKEECSLDIEPSRIVGIYSNPNRHPWKHVIAVCYAAHVVGGEIKAGSQEENAKFFKINNIPNRLAFDHAKMIRDYTNR